MRIRPYAASDQAGCLALFEANCPPAFDPGERTWFEQYLAAEPAEFWVLEADGRVVGCGGYGSRDQGRTWELYWGMIDPRRHGRGLGRRLLLYRLEHLRRQHPACAVLCRTSQHAAGFFVRHGFVPVRAQDNFWGPGLHLHELSLPPAAKAPPTR